VVVTGTHLNGAGFVVSHARSVLAATASLTRRTGTWRMMGLPPCSLTTMGS
jgi:hypothetical protein